MFLCLRLHKHGKYMLNLEDKRSIICYQKGDRAAFWFVLLAFFSFSITSTFASDLPADDKKLGEFSTEQSSFVYAYMVAPNGTVGTIKNVDFTGINYNYITNNFQNSDIPKVDLSEIDLWDVPPFDEQKIVDQKQDIDKIAQGLKNTSVADNTTITRTCIYGEGCDRQKLLANYIIRNPPNNYQYRAWFSAENVSKLDSGYSALGSKMKIFPESTPIEEKRSHIKNFFANNPNYLLVYDNADDYKQLEPYLPSRGGHVIITSSNSEWLSLAKVIDVGKDENDSCYTINLGKKYRLVRNYHVRNQSAPIDDLKSRLKKHGVVAITGITGSGKTQLAYYYADNVFRKDDRKKKVVVLPCDSEKHLQEEYYEYAVQQLNMPEIKDRASRNILDIQRNVKKILNSPEHKDTSFVLIFDNVDKLSHKTIKGYYPENLVVDKQQIIITSQKRDFFSEEKEQNFAIGGFTDEEAVEFITMVPDLKLKKEEALKLAKEFSNLPLGLQYATMYLERNNTLSVDEYLKSINSRKDSISIDEEEQKLIEGYGYYDGARTQRAAISLVIDGLSEEAKFFLQCSTFYYADSISMPVLKHLLSTKFELSDGLVKIKIGSILKECQDYCLILPNITSESIAMLHIVQRVIEPQIIPEQREEILDQISEYFRKTYSDPILLYANIERSVKDPETIMLKVLAKSTLDQKDVGIFETMIILASQIDHRQLAAEFINKEAVMNQATRGSTVLMIASYKGLVEEVESFLAKGAKVNQTDENGWTALMMASHNGHVKVVKSLLAAKGAEVDQVDYDGWTALMMASHNGHVEVVELLLKYGADPHKKNKLGETAIDIAEISGNKDCIEILIRAGKKEGKHLKKISIWWRYFFG